MYCRLHQTETSSVVIRSVEVVDCVRIIKHSKH